MPAPPTTPPTPYTAAPFVPKSRSIKTLAVAALDCRGCPLFVDTTQTVFGKGPTSAPLILVGEQPGDVEDKRGTPFVGPAGAVLWQCLEAAGIDHSAVYTTNAVKHFKHEMPRQATVAQTTRHRGDRGVSPVARRRAGGAEGQAHRRAARRRRGALAAGPDGSRRGQPRDVHSRSPDGRCS